MAVDFSLCRNNPMIAKEGELEAVSHFLFVSGAWARARQQAAEAREATTPNGKKNQRLPAL